MITLYHSSDKGYSQKDYEKSISSCNLHHIPCSCKMKGHFIKHGYYNRSVKTSDGYIPLSILRVHCKHCGRTHAILPSFLVPYSRHLLSDHIKIARSNHRLESYQHIMDDNPYIEPSNITSIRKRFLKHWKERLTSILLSLKSTITTIIQSCFLSFSRQFMQVRKGWNYLYY